MPKHTDLAYRIRTWLLDCDDKDIIQVSEPNQMHNATDIFVELRNGKTLTVTVIDDSE